jgi:hypothetical protein
MVDQEARKRIEALEAQGVQRDREIADLSGRLSRLAATLGAVLAEVSGRAPARPIDSPAVPANPPARASPVARPPPPTPNAPAPSSVPAPPHAPAGFASLIVADFPPLFAEGEKRWLARDTPPGILAEFRVKRFTLLWRGSRDGFGARDFHGRCDGHANTLTLIEDTAGNIFGGFTPVEWESRVYNGKWGKEDNRYKADPSLKSFLFTLKNPHNFPARKFALKAEKKDQAIRCDSSWGPQFGDIGVSDNCNANASSHTYLFGLRYANDTGLDGESFFTRSRNFKLKEIEVFEITD